MTNAKRQSRQIIAYIIVGGLTTLICLAVYYILTLTILDPLSPLQLQMANIVSWLAAVVFAYFANRRYVFDKIGPPDPCEAGRFLVSRLLTLLADMFIMGVFVSLLKSNDKIVKPIDQIIIIVANYVLAKYMVFTEKREKDPS